MPLFLVLALYAAVNITPPLVNAVAYLAGTAPVDTFVPQSYKQVCNKGGCSTDTIGIVQHDGATSGATWHNQVPLGKPFPVRGPVWSWNTGSELTGSTGSAIMSVVLGVLFDAIALLLLLAIVRFLWRRRRARGQHAIPS
jgi:hypothetical protein